MGHTPKQRNMHPLCGAKKKNGELCRAWAGMGTDHPGVGRCRFHFGNSPSHKKAAVKQTAIREAVRMGLGAAVEIEPHDALLSMLHLAAGHTSFLRDKIEELDETDLATGAGLQLVSLYGAERDRVAKVAKHCLDVGVSERQVRVAERTGHAVAAVLSAVFADAELALSASQRAVLPAVVGRHLREAEAPAIGRAS